MTDFAVSCWLLQPLCSLSHTDHSGSALKKQNIVKLLLHQCCTSAFLGRVHCELTVLLHALFQVAYYIISVVQ